ncbi:MAG: flagellar basal-body rod protein FlgG [Thermodesulfovibrio sp.]|jgi:flagellar basal-body rod protein FlgG|uniref:flagellar basal-body rod protein FlgG n=1 Tax=unclassified Thermodesulfovibrio TaxID=2645936 RepID=UPI00083AF8E1|nr:MULTISPECIES: flagellar basal-body rod protein FlgG [unclassified Thermodesulfovibrio]MDI1471794.1 flagellar basal-body rod protein FlgG [Thermodesulfovibrio sp. 1176]MDI6713684.1 flagellar basal-body rod protein FlgG [Thermodesulfovibrio sp.]ODA44184.1 Flagellar basal-body rod protein FlgG [Thermodesulfovibrio sp. N1]
MLRSLFTASTGMYAQQLNVDVISHNLANVNTTGFKKGRAEFQDLLYQNIIPPGAPSDDGTQYPTGIQVGLGVRPVAVAKFFTPGDLVNTGNSLDLAIDGDGFFQVTLPDGTIAYTRAGNFRIDRDGRIVTNDGYPIEPGITVPTDATSITVGADGRVTVLQPGTVAPVEIGTIELARFVNPGGLRAIGKNLFLETDASGAPTTGAPGTEGRGTIIQGFLEMSNVNIVEELANLIIAQRAFDINSKAVQTSDEMLQTVSALKR